MQIYILSQKLLNRREKGEIARRQRFKSGRAAIVQLRILNKLSNFINLCRLIDSPSLDCWTSFEMESFATLFWAPTRWRNLCVTRVINIMKFNNLEHRSLKRPQLLRLNFSILIDIQVKLTVISICFHIDSVHFKYARAECDAIICRLSRETARVIYDTRATSQSGLLYGEKLTAHNMVSNERLKCKKQADCEIKLCKWRHGERYLPRFLQTNRVVRKRFETL